MVITFLLHHCSREEFTADLHLHETTAAEAKANAFILLPLYAPSLLSANPLGKKDEYMEEKSLVYLKKKKRS